MDTNTDHAAPVVVSLNVEGFGEHSTELVEVDRAEWDALGADGRCALLDEMATSHAANHVGWGWHIDDPADLGKPTALAPPTRPDRLPAVLEPCTTQHTP